MSDDNHGACFSDWQDGHETSTLRQGTLQVLSFSLMACSMVAATVARPDFRYPLGGQFAVFLSLLPVGALAAYLGRRNPLCAAVVIILGTSLSWAAALGCMQQNAIPYYGALITLAGFLISPRFGLSSALINALLLGFLRLGNGGWGGILFLGFITGLAWLSLRLLHTALAWSQNSQQQAARLLVALRSHQGELNGTLKMLRDSTDRLERVNSELSIARQMADEARTLKEQFVANVSHELRTPLNLIVGFSEMLYLDPDSYEDVYWTPELTSDVGELFRAAKHLQSLVDDILDLSRIDASRLPMFREVVSIEPILRESIETIMPLIRQHELFCEFDCPADIPKLFLDQTRMRQVMLNLLNNAVRYTERGGIRVQVECGEEAVLVAVHDTGVGIPEDQLQGLFERFHQAEAGRRSARGAGLGLALSRQFVELHGGKIWAQSQVGHGSTFTFSLPLPGTSIVSRSLRQSVRRTPRAAGQKSVAIVDPDPGVAEMLGRYLGDRQILPVQTIEEVEALAQQEHPQAIIINQAPTSSEMSWLEPLGAAIAESSVPIIRCSLPSPSWLAGASGFDGCLTKPISREMMRQVALDGHNYGSILVADDDTGFVNLVRRTLRVLGFEGRILTAYDGVTALRVAREQCPDLVLLDLVMPHMNGFGVAKAVRAIPDLQGMHIVAVTATAYATEAMKQKEGRLTVTQAGGIPPGQVADILEAILGVLHPDYSAGRRA